MKDIVIDRAFFKLRDGNQACRFILSGLRRFAENGFSITVNGTIPASIKRVLDLEEISVTVNESLTADIDVTYAGNLRLAADRFLQRKGLVKRITKETDIEVEVNLDSCDDSIINTGIGFFDHMLEQIARHGNMSLRIIVKGDLHVDEHHTVEDTGIALGEAIAKALGDKKGITRYGFMVPMDESKAFCAIDIGGRQHLRFQVTFKRQAVGGLPTELIEDFFIGFSSGLKANIHISAIGRNEHHKIEAVFKALAKTLNEACRFDERAYRRLPSTKGII